MGYGYDYGGWAPYVPVAVRRQRAKKKMESLRKKGVDVQPVEIAGRLIAKTFWGKAWCDHLESFSDFENRLPRGRTYVRNGSVCHLAIAKGTIEAKVSGSELYKVKVSIKTLPGKKWSLLKQRCSGQVGSLLELLQGRLSNNVMEVVTDRKEGLFPLPGEMSFHCSCPDWASMCKHVAAALYGIGNRLDTKPELLFLLRGVDHSEMIQADAEKAVDGVTSRGKSKRLAATEIEEVFGIEIESVVQDNSQKANAAKPKSGRKTSTRQSTKTKIKDTSRISTRETKKQSSKLVKKKSKKKQPIKNKKKTKVA